MSGHQEVTYTLDLGGSATRTLREIDRRGWRLKSWTRKKGEFRTGGPFALNSLRRLLTNILYTGAIRHKGQAYAGEHAAILPLGQWERVQSLITRRSSFARGRLRNKHQALLSGLLYCECCEARMVYAYALKGGRKYPYYVCRNAQQKGWAVCPSKSLPAQAIEESVVRRIRETQGGIAEATEWEQMDRTIQLEIIQTIVERVGYDGTSRQVSIRFQSTGVATTGEETRA